MAVVELYVLVLRTCGYIVEGRRHSASEALKRSNFTR